MTRAWTRSCAACFVRKGLIFLMLGSANLQDWKVFAMCSLKVSWSSKITPRFLTELDGVIVDGPNWIVKSCCRVGVAGKTRSSLPGWAVGDVLSSMPRCLPSSLRSGSYRWIIWSKWEIELCVISVEMVGETMCLYDGTQWCSVCGEEEGSKNWSLRNPSDQLMCFGYLPSPGHPERPTSTIGFKPAKWSPSDVQWWEGGQEDLMIDSVKSGRQIQQNEDWWYGISFCNSQGFSDWE